MASALKVFMVPTFRNFNKYCSALIRGIRNEGVDLSCVDEWTPALPLLTMLNSSGLPHVIHLHWIETYTIKTTWLRSLLASVIFLLELVLLKILTVKIVWTVHDYLNVDGKFPSLEVTVRRLTVRLANSIIVHTEAARREVMSLYKLSKHLERKITVVPHGHFIGEYPNVVSRRVARETLGLEDKCFVFGFVGYLRPYKGVQDLIQAFRRIPRKDYRLVIAGMPFDASFADAVRHAALGDSRIRFDMRFINDDELQTFLNAIDVMVFPHSRSLTSGSLILAMSFAKPVVAADHPTTREVLPHGGGFFYATDDPENLTRALAGIQTQNMASMGQANRRRAELYDWQSIAKATTVLYYKAIGDAPPAFEISTGLGTK